jgi:hypothetical protein
VRWSYGRWSQIPRQPQAIRCRLPLILAGEKIPAILYNRAQVKISPAGLRYETTLPLAQILHLHETKRRDEARTILTEIYNWFSEGFDLPT